MTMSELPAGLAAAMQDGEPVTPRDSASVLVLDSRAVPWRVLMMRRPRGADFAPDAWVFPGGSVTAEDRSRDDPPRAAALRELWEEMGLLLAWRAVSGRRQAATTVDSARVRAAVAGGLGFWAALEDLGLRPDTERLVLTTRWITPLPLRRRFDTRFYALRAPDQEVVPQDGEVVDWGWVTAKQALAGEGVVLVYATRRILELVAPEPDADALLRRLRRRRERDPIVPRISRSSGELTIADDAAPLFR